MSAMHRIGLLVPSSNTTMETEVPALLRAREAVRPEDTFSFHSARLRMADVTPEGLRAMNEETGRAAAELADLRPDVVATACLVAIMAQGPGSHHAAEAEIEAVLERGRAAAPVVSSAGALVDALHALGARRIGLVAPYIEELTRLVVAYLEHTGVEVADTISLEVPDNRAVAAPRPARARTTVAPSRPAGVRRDRPVSVRADALARGARGGGAPQRAADAVRRDGDHVGDPACARPRAGRAGCRSAPCCCTRTRPVEGSSPDRRAGANRSEHTVPGSTRRGLTYLGQLVVRFARRASGDYSRVTVRRLGWTT